MKIKMFSTILYGKVRGFITKRLREPLHVELESEIQAWLAQRPNIKIHDIKQSMAGGSYAPCKVIVSIYYE